MWVPRKIAKGKNAKIVRRGGLTDVVLPPEVGQAAKPQKIKSLERAENPSVDGQDAKTMRSDLCRIQQLKIELHGCSKFLVGGTLL